MLSLHTNSATLSAQNSISRTQHGLSTSMTRLSTGFRINSAMDDAAGLQIATRLKAQTSGMSMAMRNTQNSISMMQTAEGALDEATNILVRMKDLATQSADGSSTTSDRTAMQAEYNSLTSELGNIIKNTSFGGTTLLNNTTGALGKFAATVNFQIGASTAETMTVNVSTDVGTLHSNLLLAAGAFNGGTATAAAYAGKEISDTAANDGTGAANANATIDKLKTAIDSVSTVRSALGASANRLDHVYNNLSNISNNTKAATGRIMDVDFATESSNMTTKQMLMQAGTAMLKQTNSMSSMVMSLLQ